jgi:hypothetical protein
LAEDEQTSKHGGGGRYNGILQFKGGKYENEYKEKKEYIYIYIRKGKNEYVKNKIK